MIGPVIKSAFILTGWSMNKLKRPRPEIIVSIQPVENNFWWKIKKVSIIRTTDIKKTSEDLIKYAKNVIQNGSEGTIIKVELIKTLFLKTVNK